MQQAGQVCPDSFWNYVWSRGWYKCGFPAYKLPEKDEEFPTEEMKTLSKKLKATSDSGMERYRISLSPSNLRPFTGRLGNCSTRATVYPGDNDKNDKPREVQVLVDTGAEISIIESRHVPENVPVLSVPAITVSGFGGGSADLDRRVQLRMKLHGEDKSKGIDIQTTAYIMDKTASGLGVELGTDVMKPLGAIVDIQRGVLKVESEEGKTYESPILYLKDEDKIKEPTPQINEDSTSPDPIESKKESHQSEQTSEGQDEAEQSVTCHMLGRAFQIDS